MIGHYFSEEEEKSVVECIGMKSLELNHAFYSGEMHSYTISQKSKFTVPSDTYSSLDPSWKAVFNSRTGV